MGEYAREKCLRQLSGRLTGAEKRVRRNAKALSYRIRFSDQYNCPLPPRNNRFPVPVTAGEKRVVLRDGAAH